MNIPSRFRKPAFDRFAAVLGAALRAHPKAIVADPSPWSPDTFANNFRNAIRAKQLHGYTSKEVDEMLFLQRAGTLKCRTRPEDGQVVIGPAEALREPTGIKFGSSPDASTSIDFRGGPADLDRLCYLIAAKCFPSQPVFTIRGLTTPDIEALEERYPVVFTPDSSDPSVHTIL